MKVREPGQSALLLLDVVSLLADEELNYIVIGAMAAAIHGSIRATTDADALLSISVSGLARLEKGLRRAGFETELRRGDADDPIPALLGVSDASGNRVDLLAGLRGLDPQIFSRAITVSFAGKSIRVVGLEDFVAMKCFAGGPQDLMDASNALHLAQSPDVDLLRRLARRFGRDAADRLEQLLG